MFCVTILDIFIIEVSSAVLRDVIRDRIVGNVCKVSPARMFPCYLLVHPAQELVWEPVGYF